MKKELISILDDLIELLNRKETDVRNTYFKNPQQVIKKVQRYKIRVKFYDPTVKFAILLLFVPTTELQDIAIGSNWSDEYMQLADQFDELLKIP